VKHSHLTAAFYRLNPPQAQQKTKLFRLLFGDGSFAVSEPLAGFKFNLFIGKDMGQK
jgi:hypothetical protein